MESVLCDEDQKHSKGMFPCIWQAVVMLVVTGIMLVLLGVCIGVSRGVFEGLYGTSEEMSIIFSFAEVAVNLVGFSSVIIFSMFITKISIKDMMRELPFVKTATLLLPLAVAVIGCGILESEMDNITRYFFPVPKFLICIIESVTQHMIPAFFLFVIVAPLTEELLFRGIILRGFLSHYSPLLSIVVSALLFSIFHINPYQFFSAFAMGLLLGWLYYRTGSIRLSIYGHAFHNLICYVFIFKLIPLDIKGFAIVDLSKNVFQPIWLDVLGLFLMILGIVSLLLMTSKAATRNTPPSELLATEEV